MRSRSRVQPSGSPLDLAEAEVEEPAQVGARELGEGDARQAVRLAAECAHRDAQELDVVVVAEQPLLRVGAWMPLARGEPAQGERTQVGSSEMA